MTLLYIYKDHVLKSLVESDRLELLHTFNWIRKEAHWIFVELSLNKIIRF